ncbi:hypothetical protein BSL82_05605 [Tardibacter chloracetimidivorans]|uniref:Uncharacterized protein n=1 Tax=Tardibacter chloracetimidivorans TaxID=1921510 RepID=A0A1L3ZTA1_9SPHN|nr:hypothetical protein [Tardibacter chloracetimidivorans]API58848.1 hypothetical protein BSL82_05605 [Tardibacter chloracetimidivorans]
MIGQPYLALVGVLALVAAYGAGRCDAHKIEAGKQAAIDRAEAAAEAKYQRASADRARQELEREARDETASNTITRTIERIVTQPGPTVYRNVCWDGDGVRAYNLAVELANDRPGILPAAVRETGNPAAGRKDRGDDADAGD